VLVPLCLLSIQLLATIPTASATIVDNIFPKRTEEEAAVFEWGNSAIISALDASVAMFGPQTSQAALLEVECKPVLAAPVNGIIKGKKDDDEFQIQPLKNADEVQGNIVVMTNAGGLSGVQMAKIAKLSNAAALMVVNIDEKNPDYIYRLQVEEGEEEDASNIDIPVVMISLNSANVLTTATVEPNTDVKDIVNNGMPDRIRLYAGGDRPFFEDIRPLKPTLYLIHNLMTGPEAKALVDAAKHKVEPIQTTSIDTLQLQTQPQNFPGVESAMLWKGKLATPGQLAIEERIEQVTGFPKDHFSDFVVDKLTEGDQWLPHYDLHPDTYSFNPPIATITVFLNELSSNESEGGSIEYYPSGARKSSTSKKNIRVLPQKGLAIVHHNLDDKDRYDTSTLHALLPLAQGETLFVARKYVFDQPVSTSRKVVLPAFAFLFGGKLPKFVVTLHDALVEQFGPQQGSVYFDKACVFVPLLILLSIVQFVVNYLKDQMTGGSSSKDSKSETSSKKKKSSKKDKKGKSD